MDVFGVVFGMSRLGWTKPNAISVALSRIDRAKFLKQKKNNRKLLERAQAAKRIKKISQLTLDNV